VFFFLSFHLIWASLIVEKKKKSSVFGKCIGPVTPKVKLINLMPKEVQIHTCTVEGVAQTILSSVLLLWTPEEFMDTIN